MPAHSYKIFTLLVSVLLVLTPHEVLGEKKSKRHKKKLVAMVIPEPDILPEKAIKSKVIFTPKEAEIKDDWSDLSKEGIDVSHYQHTIDWEALVKGNTIGYAYMKATEGESLVDDTYRYNLTNAKKAGLKVGSYHYYRPNADPELQFQNITANIKAEEQDLAIIIDVESRGRVSHNTFISGLKKFLERVEQHYKSKPILYTFQNFYNKYLSGEFKDYKLMIAKYHEERPVLNDGHEFTIWQYTSKGTIDGINGFVDRNMVMPEFHITDISFDNWK